MSAPTRNLAACAEAWRSDGILYHPNPGNGGDALIAEATYRFFEAAGIPYRILRDPFDEATTGAHVVSAAGGNLTGDYPHARRLIEAAHARAASLTVLPHTYKQVDDLLGQLGPNTTLFAREARSWEYLRQFENLGGIGLEHDLALGLGDDPRFAAEIRRARFLALRRFAKIQWIKARGLARGFRSPLRLNSFREDVESARATKPADNLDLSKQINYDPDMRDRALVRRTTLMFLGTIAWFSTIHTDRLHVAIGGCLLGKRVHLYENSYWKNREIYEFSLRKRFPKVRLVEREEATA